MYLLDVDADGFKPLLLINITARALIPLPQTPTVDEDDFVKHKSLGYHLRNIDDHPMNIEYHLMDAKDSEYFQEERGERGLRSQSNQYFSDGTNFYIEKHSVARMR